jgi:restriction endonuclease S subunit
MTSCEKNLLAGLSRISMWARSKATMIPIPPLTEQQRIVARVEELRRLCVQLRERLTDARRTQSHLADALVAEVAA